jgi:maltose O-acetyltransferase
MKAFFRAIVHSLANRLLVISRNAQLTRLKATLKSCGKNVSVYMPVRIDGAENVEVGDNVGIAPFVHMWGGGGIKIGNCVMIGAHTAITSEGHDINKEIMYGTLTQKPVIIEDNADIGAHCLILPGVTIGKGAVIGAGSVISMNVKPLTIVVTGRQREEWPRRFVGRQRELAGKPTI